MSRYLAGYDFYFITLLVCSDVFCFQRKVSNENKGRQRPNPLQLEPFSTAVKAAAHNRASQSTAVPSKLVGSVLAGVGVLDRQKDLPVHRVSHIPTNALCLRSLSVSDQACFDNP